MKGLKRVLIEGKPYAVIYDMYGLSEIMTETGSTLGDIVNMSEKFSDFTKIGGDDLKFILDVVYFGFKGGAEEEGKELPYSKRQLARHVPLNGAVFAEVMQEFQRGINSAIGAEEEVTEEAKKKPKAKAVA